MLASRQYMLHNLPQQCARLPQLRCRLQLRFRRPYRLSYRTSTAVELMRAAGGADWVDHAQGNGGRCVYCRCTRHDVSCLPTTFELITKDISQAASYINRGTFLSYSSISNPWTSLRTLAIDPKSTCASTSFNDKMLHRHSLKHFPLPLKVAMCLRSNGQTITIWPPIIIMACTVEKNRPNFCIVWNHYDTLKQTFLYIWYRETV